MKKGRAFFYILKNSVFNLDYYQDVIKAPLSLSLKYFYCLLFLVALAFIVPVAIFFLTLSPRTAEISKRVQEEVATFYPRDLVLKINDGRLSINQEEPYFIDGSDGARKFVKETTGKDHLVAIDTNASPSDFSKYQAMVLLTKEAAIYPKSYQGAQRTEVMPFNETEDVTLTQSIYLAGVSRLNPIFEKLPEIFTGMTMLLLIAGPPLAAGLVFIQKIIHLLIITVFGVFIARMIGLPLNFKQILQVGIHSSTLPIVFFTGLFVFGLSPAIPFGYSLVLLLFMGAVFYNLKGKGKK